MYDGWRRGMSGLGGAGVLGYFVKAPTGDVGDLRCADMSFCSGLPVAPRRELVDCPFLCLRCRRDSSLCSLILMDRREGLISSELCKDLARGGLLLESLSISDSDSLESPDVEEPEDGAGRVVMAFPLPMLIVSPRVELGRSSNAAFSCIAAAILRGSAWYAPKSLLNCSQGAKCPCSS